MSTPDPAPALDAGDENADLMVGEEVEAEHGLDVSAFADDPDDTLGVDEPDEDEL